MDADLVWIVVVFQMERALLEHCPNTLLRRRAGEALKVCCGIWRRGLCFVGWFCVGRLGIGWLESV